jgi:hypothetical protein
VTKPICAEPGCTEASYARGFCQRDYNRHRNRGEFQGTNLIAPHDITGRRYGLLVAIRREGKLWICRCDCGATRRATVSALNAGDYRHCGNRSLHRNNVNAGYRTVHTRLEAQFGKASTYPCVDCGYQAAEWSYDGTDEQQVGKSSAYSRDLGHYQPRCVQCHTDYDMKHGQRGIVAGRLHRRPARRLPG